MEEIPVLTDQERAVLLAELKDAETRMAAGEYIDFDPGTFKERLLRIYHDSKRRS